MPTKVYLDGDEAHFPQLGVVFKCEDVADDGFHYVLFELTEEMRNWVLKNKDAKLKNDEE